MIASNLFDDDIERGLLSAILYDNLLLSEVMDILEVADFHHPGHADIYRVMVECAQGDQPVDEFFIKNRLGSRYNESVLNGVVAASPIINAKQYAMGLKEMSIKRALLHVASKIPEKIDEAANDGKEARLIVDNISEEIYSLVDDSQGGVLQTASEAVVAAVSEIKRRKEQGSGLLGISTGYSELDRLTKGLKGGELIIIAARPGMGKTTFALNIVENVLRKGNGVVFFSLEMPAVQLMFRLLSSRTSIDLGNIMNGDLSDEQLESLSFACDKIKETEFFIYDSGDVTIAKVRTQLRRLKEQHPSIKLCVIDYIGLMGSSGSFSERHLQIAEISRGLKLLARELDLPIIALSQLNRTLESRSNKRPMLSDLRESGAIEQDADMIMFVYRGDLYLEQENKEKIARAREEGREVPAIAFKAPPVEQAEIIVGKNRNGPTGTVNLSFDKAHSRFTGTDTIKPPQIYTAKPAEPAQ